MATAYQQKFPSFLWIHISDARCLIPPLVPKSFDIVMDFYFLRTMALPSSEGSTPALPDNLLECNKGGRETREDLEAGTQAVLRSISNLLVPSGAFLSIGWVAGDHPSFYDMEYPFGWEPSLTTTSNWHRVVENARVGGRSFDIELYVKRRRDVMWCNKAFSSKNTADKSCRVYTCVVGDLWHYGHAHLCRASRALGGPGAQLIVGICSDADVADYKRHPIMTATERGMAAASCRWVSLILPPFPNQLVTICTW